MDQVELRPEEKRCSKCGEVKGREEFSKDKRRKDGLRGWCRECRSVYSLSHFKRNRVGEVIAYPAEKICPKCGKTKPLEGWSKDRGRKDGLKGYCKVCDNAAKVTRRRNLTQTLFDMLGGQCPYTGETDIRKVLFHHKYAIGPYSKKEAGGGGVWMRKLVQKELPLESCIVMATWLHVECSGGSVEDHCARVAALVPGSRFPKPHPAEIELAAIKADGAPKSNLQRLAEEKGLKWAKTIKRELYIPVQPPDCQLSFAGSV